MVGQAQSLPELNLARFCLTLLHEIQIVFSSVQKATIKKNLHQQVSFITHQAIYF